MVRTILKSRSSGSINSQSVVPLALPIAGPDDGDTGHPTAELDPPKIITKPKKEKTKGKKKRKGKDVEKDVEDYQDPTKCYDEYQKQFETEEVEKSFKCFHLRVGWSDLCKIITLWFLIAGLALSIQIVEKFSSGSRSKIKDEVTTCSLCPAGKSMTNPDHEIVLTEFQCSAVHPSLESMCFFECPGSLPTPRIYTCGEVEQLAEDASNNCSDSADSCRELQQADIQCCH